MKDVMLDLETFGTEPGCVIRSIGAVMFDLQGGIGETFYRNITPDSCQEAGLFIDNKTREWWDRQSQQAQDSLLVDQISLVNAVAQFQYWWKTRGAVRVWCQGATFDAPVWQAACKAIGHAVPWKFWDVRDTRTAYDLYRFDPKTLKREGTYHNALDDAKYQVNCVHAALGVSAPEPISVFA